MDLKIFVNVDRITFRIIVYSMLCIVIACLVPDTGEAIPVFARRYETSCQTCHVAYPMLNPFGQAFKNNGYRFPENDDSIAREPMVELGSEQWKQLWPRAVWPGKIPKWFPLAIKLDFAFRYALSSPVKVRSDMSFPDRIDALVGGNLGGPFSYFVHLIFFHNGKFGELERGFIQIHPLKESLLLNFRIGAFDIRAVPYPLHTSLIRQASFFVDAPVDALSLRLGYIPVFTVQDPEQWVPGETQRGIELWGVKSFLSWGFEWSLGVVNGNGPGNHQMTEDEPSNQPFNPADNNNAKDIYGRIALKLGGYPIDGRLPTPKENRPYQPLNLMSWQDQSFSVGFSFYRGQQPLIISSEDHIRRYGLDIVGWWKDFRVLFIYWWGTNITREISPTFLPALNDITDIDISSQYFLLEINVVALPWLVTVIRRENLKISEIRIKGTDPGVLLPVPETPERWVFHITALVRANVKITLESVIYPDERYKRLNMVQARLVLAL